ncbi:histidinol-phosphate aminotransferase [Desulfosporosinus orientis DSM 765]|uniref:Histidinol-phosphate aminotransferase n=1 Tax=Desulfosporosinus orientis (strain ATCC 19365 / DSM 765 / NCIMB 8382 / VKM B-1628 / Singapore I) TaxID=768706 RepID=G7W7Z8_DESOD|nr:histidinol-phosphate transaminase [Desulfosporosinus orientis]AET66424.1 histidinol-phosphate aminotransferase [Desulfosporosinus orientis DSM 765]
MEFESNNLGQFVRSAVRELIPYKTQHLPECIKLDANENPFPWPAEMREALLSEQLAFNRYPDGTGQELKTHIAKYTATPPESILIGNGSDELIQMLLLTFGGAGKSLLIHPPTFGMYQIYARLTETEVVSVPLLNGLDLDTEGMLQSAKAPEAQIVIICNPNNPTGSLFPRADILRIVGESGKIVVVDEAYAEFSGESLISEIENYPNLVIMRTFSKAFGMAGLRLGYLVGQLETIDLINRVRPPFNVNSFSQRAGILALRYLPEYQEQIQQIKAETQKLQAALQEVPDLIVYPTKANFILFKPQNADQWASELLKRGFLVRNMGDLPQLGKCLRISVGLPEENDRLIQAVAEIRSQVF